MGEDDGESPANKNSDLAVLEGPGTIVQVDGQGTIAGTAETVAGTMVGIVAEL